MRNAHQNVSIIAIPRDPGLDDTVTAGVCMGYGMCAEHEYGIKDLNRAFGIGQETGVLGLGGRKMTRHPDPRNLLWFDNGTECGLVYESMLAYKLDGVMKTAEGADMRLTARYKDGSGIAVLSVEHVNYAGMTMFESDRMPDLGIRPLAQSMGFVDPGTGRRVYRKPRNKAEKARLAESNEGIRSSWSDRDFAVIGCGTEARHAVGMLRDALVRGDLILSMGAGKVPFAKSCLNLMDIKAVPGWFLQDCVDKDVDHNTLVAAVKETSIEERLRNAGRRYYALSPEWIVPSDNNGLIGLVKTECEFRFWLNPMDQKENRHGWFSLYDLEDWIDGKGVIPMNPEQELHQDFNRRLRHRLDPVAYDRVAAMALDAGIDLSWDTHDEAVDAYQTDGTDLHVGNQLLLRVSKHGSETRPGWYTAQEVVAHRAGMASPLDSHAYEDARTLEDAMAALAMQSSPTLPGA